MSEDTYRLWKLAQDASAAASRAWVEVSEAQHIDEKNIRIAMRRAEVSATMNQEPKS